MSSVLFAYLSGFLIAQLAIGVKSIGVAAAVSACIIVYIASYDADSVSATLGIAIIAMPTAGLTVGVATRAATLFCGPLSQKLLRFALATGAGAMSLPTIIWLNVSLSVAALALLSLLWLAFIKNR